MPLNRTPGTQILLQFRWQVAEGELTSEAIRKLEPYITRYAETLNVGVAAVGGMPDHLHILADVPPAMAPERVSRELMPPTARYLRDVLQIRPFTWNAETVAIQSATPWERDEVREYIAEQDHWHQTGEINRVWEGITEEAAAPAEDELPAWLTDAMKKP